MKTYKKDYTIESEDISMFKKVIGTKDRHIQVNANITCLSVLTILDAKLNFDSYTSFALEPCLPSI